MPNADILFVDDDRAILDIVREYLTEVGYRIDVVDNGPGIAAEHQPRIFERFYRVDKARSRELGGTGLGLSIVRHLAESMGASVSVESEPGRGARFSVTLPAGQPRRASA